MSTQISLPSANLLQIWVNEPTAARDNLRSIFKVLNADDSQVAWASEALENCGPPLESDLEFLENATTEILGDVAYWACTLIGRLGSEANDSQAVLGVAMLSEHVTAATRQEAALALGLIGTLTTASREALQKTCKSSDLRLARLATQSLGTSS